MAGQNQGGVNMDQFEAFFKREDLDHDGRISGGETVAFFQGSGLNKQILAQIWMRADQNRGGFLGFQEFFNALKLVRVAQSKRELTPDIVRWGSGMPPASQNLGYRGPLPPNQNMQQQYFPPPGNQLMRPAQGLPSSSASLPIQSGHGLPNSGVSPTGVPNSGLSIPGRPSLGMSTPGFPSSDMSNPGFPSAGMSNPGFPSSGMSSSGFQDQVPNKGTTPSTPQNMPVTSQTAHNSFNASAASPSNPVSGGDPFAAFSMSKPGASPATSSAIVPVSFSPPASSMTTSSAIVPVASATQPPLRSNSLDSLQIYRAPL
ncbi:hypothetical protein SOVF_176950 [Spinacia oleracea]|nr:hypothetical protein SOVF_176950 [Spinacia oleracea]